MNLSEKLRYAANAGAYDAPEMLEAAKAIDKFKEYLDLTWREEFEASMLEQEIREMIG